MAFDPIAMIALGSSLAACVGAVALVADQRVRDNRQRIAGVMRPYQLSRAAPAGAARRATLVGETLAPSRALLFLGIRRDRPDLYPLPWWGLLFLGTLVTLAFSSLVVFLIGDVAWAATPLLWVMVSRSLFGHFLTKRTNTLYMQLPDALSMVVRSVRVGITVQDSLRVVGEESQFPTSLEFRRLEEEMRFGASLSDALTRLAQRSDLIEYRFFAVALSLQNQAGGSLSDTLENLADVVRKRVALRARAIALAAEARLTMYVLAGLPFVTIGALMVISPDYIMILFTTSMGKKLLFAGLSLLGLGMYSMRFIIKKSVS